MIRRADVKVLSHSYERALFECLQKGAAHQPHILKSAFKMHTTFQETGSMKVQ